MNTEGFEKKPISVGPWGGTDGDLWDDGVYTTVKQLVIAHGAGIDCMQIEYDKKGSSVWSGKHGGSGGIKVDQIKLDFPDEFLTSISGHYGSINDWSPVFVRSLTFQSNRKTYGPFGTQQGNQFSFSMNGGRIVGFHGRSGWYLDSIGVYLKPLSPKSYSSKPLVSSQSFVANGTEKVGYNLVQGSGKGYDIVLAIKQKDDFNKFPSEKISREFSSSSSNEDESNNKLFPLPTNIKNGSSNVENGVVSYGPWGGSGGSIFDDGVYTGVRQVNLTRSAGIISIRVLYDRNGKAIWGNKHGGSGAMKSDKIVFDYPFEALTHITGYYGPLMYMGPVVIKSLTFHTTKKNYGPFGDAQGTPFSSNLKEGKIVGFFGKRGWYIDSIGVHVIEGKVSTPRSSRNVSSNLNNDMPIAEMDNPQWSNKLVLAKRGGPNEEVTYGVVKEPAPCGPGPWGGDGGRPWDDGVFTGVKQIFLTRAEAICSIQIEYDRNGQSVWSVRHGGSGEATNKIKFDYPHEVVTCVCGYYGPINRDDRMKAIKSLTIFTSRGKYGPYGEEVGTFFTSTTTEGKVLGFHGRSSLYLDAIGVHMQHWLGQGRPSKSMFYKIFG
ncbi:hypothetical protein AQUCO_00700319v1 [Aquilegia coerulea]|uniref:Jacalin-type lectin domain-containing protein n=1 Tax=Aquilegia coerulea TaxID=218851 RepID=A0A2G5EJI9_AQUCA|nr:hypothetical protein AQUCO_00700319v1 [Aquilegia coerulea]